MKKFKILCSVLFTCAIMLSGIYAESIIASTFSLTFHGTLYREALYGNANNQYYAFYANKPLYISGTAHVDSLDKDHYKGEVTVTRAACYYQNSSGKTSAICSKDFVVSDTDTNKYFSMSGTTKEAGGHYFLVFVKQRDDHINLSLDGTLTSSN